MVKKKKTLAAKTSVKQRSVHNPRSGEQPHSRERILPFVRPGQQLRFVEKLKKHQEWPPGRCKPKPPRDRKTVTPYIVVPARTGDRGLRPLPDEQALFNESVWILNSLGQPVSSPVKGESYTLAVRILNRGAMGAFGGMVEFYIAPSAVFDTAAATPRPTLPAQGYGGFSAVPGETVEVRSPNKWTPATDAEARQSVLIQAFDPFIDRVSQPFDGRLDRHVGRRDWVPDFSGIWDGTYSDNHSPELRYRIRIVIGQSGLSVSAWFYMQVSGGLPTIPQDTSSGTIVAGHIQMSSTEYWGPANQPFTSNQWTLSLSPSGHLHFDSQRHYLMPGDGRPDLFTSGDLVRL